MEDDIKIHRVKIVPKWKLFLFFVIIQSFFLKNIIVSKSEFLMSCLNVQEILGEKCCLTAQELWEKKSKANKKNISFNTCKKVNVLQSQQIKYYETVW